MDDCRVASATWYIWEAFTGDISREQEGGREDGLVRWGVLSKVPTGMRPPGTFTGLPRCKYY